MSGEMIEATCGLCGDTYKGPRCDCEAPTPHPPSWLWSNEPSPINGSPFCCLPCYMAMKMTHALLEAVGDPVDDQPTRRDD